MSAEITVGSVGVEVVPTAENFARDLRAKLRPAAELVGKELGRQIGAAMESGIEDGIKDGVKQGATKAAIDKSLGAAFARILKGAGEIRGAFGSTFRDASKSVDDTTKHVGLLQRAGDDLARGFKDVLGPVMRGALTLVGDALSNLFVDLKVTVAGIVTGAQDIGAGLAGVASGGWAAVTSMAALITLGVAAAPALVPIFAAITAAVAGLVAVLGAASLGLGALGVVGFGVIQDIFTKGGDYQTAKAAQAKALASFQKQQIGAEFALGFDKGGGKSPGAAAAALALAQKQGLGSKYLPAGLSQAQKSGLAQGYAKLQTANTNLAGAKQALGPGGVAVANQWTALGAQYDTIKQQLAPQVFPILSAGLKLVSSALSYLAPVVKAVAPVITGLLAQAGAALSSPAAKEFAAFIAKEAPKAIGELGTLAGNLIGFVGRLIVAFTPIGQAVLKWLGDVGRSLAGAFKGPGFGQFVAYVKAEAPQVAAFFKSVWTLVLELGAALWALRPAGDAVLRGLTGVADFLSAVLRPALGFIVASIEGFVTAFLKGLGAVLGAAASTAKFFHLPFAKALSDAHDSVTRYTNDFITQTQLVNAQLAGTVTYLDDAAKPRTAKLDVQFNVNGQAVNGTTWQPFPANAFTGPNAVSHSGSHPSGVKVYPKSKHPYGKVLTSALGGLVTGPGGPTSDSIPAMLSNHEYVVNAAATARNRALLDHINAGREVQTGRSLTANVNVNGYGAEQVAGVVQRQFRALELLYG